MYESTVYYFRNTSYCVDLLLLCMYYYVVLVLLMCWCVLCMCWCVMCYSCVLFQYHDLVWWGLIVIACRMYVIYHLYVLYYYDWYVHVCCAFRCVLLLCDVLTFYGVGSYSIIMLLTAFIIINTMYVFYCLLLCLTYVCLFYDYLWLSCYFLIIWFIMLIICVKCLCVS